MDQVEPVVVAVVQQSIEFALCYLEKWIGKSDDSSVQVLLLLIEETICFNFLLSCCFYLIPIFIVLFQSRRMDSVKLYVFHVYWYNLW